MKVIERIMCLYFFFLGGIPELLLKVQMLLSSYYVYTSVPAKKAVALITAMRFWYSVIPQSYGVTNRSQAPCEIFIRGFWTLGFPVARSP